jgi:ribose transport system permease protein
MTAVFEAETASGTLRAPAQAARARRLGPRPLRRAGIVIPFAGLFVALAVTSSGFLTTTNLLNVLEQQSPTLIIAAAMTMVLVAGGIDLSVGATAALAAVVTAKVALHADPVVAVAAGTAVGAVAGVGNGVIATTFRIDPLIATLASSFVINGIAGLVTHGNLVVLFDRPGFGDVARTEILGVKSSIWIMVVVVVVFAFVLARTVIGRYMYAAGGNDEAARLAGVSVNGVRIAAYALSGASAGLAGVLGTSRVLSAQADSGQTVTFAVITGVVVGGTSIMGGDGAVWKTVVGVLFVALVGNGSNLLGVDPLFQQIVLGAIMILAVGLDVWSRQRRI